MMVIDGSFGEGGGQILRTTLALATVLQKPVKIINIRAKRSNPGLQPQHLTVVRALAEISDAEIDGAFKGSRTLVFKPRDLKGGNYVFNIGTAGSISLVLQALLPVLSFADRPSTVEIIGGTDVPWSPPIDYIKHVMIPLLSRLGVKVLEIKVIRRGHYPRGGGRVKVIIAPVKVLNAINLTNFGKIIEVRGISHAVKLPCHVAKRQARAASEFIRERLKIEPTIDIECYEPSKDPHLGPGSGIVVWAKGEHSIMSGDSLGAKGKRAEIVGKEAAMKLIEDLSSNTALDRHMSDIIIPYLALAHGTSRITGAKLTLHTYTNIHVVSKISGAEINYEGDLNKPFKVVVKGIGLSY